MAKDSNGDVMYRGGRRRMVGEGTMRTPVDMARAKGEGPMTPPKYNAYDDVGPKGMRKGTPVGKRRR